MHGITHFINGAAVASASGRHGDVFNPNTGEVQVQVALADAAEVDRAVASALTTQVGWGQVNPQRRARVMFEIKRLVEARMDELAELLSSEHGRAIADSRGDLQRGLEVIEFACGAPHALKGEYTEGAGPGINVPIPVPVACHSFGGWKRSAFGNANQHSMEGVRFYTKVKTVTTRWPEGLVEDSAFVIPTMC